MNNPRTAIESLLETEKEVNGLTIYPITIARYGLLDLIGSPFVNTKEDFTLLNLIPSLYIMCSDTQTLKKYKLRNIEELYEDATVWSDTLNPDRINEMIEEVEEKLKTMFQVAPEAAGNSTKKAEGASQATAG